jgi:hypothetical protein
MDDRDASGWALAGIGFAGVAMLMVGIMQSLYGLAGIIKNEFFVVSPNYLYKFDATTWGWIHLILGVILVLAGIAVFRGAVWARTVGVIFATLAAIGNFLSIPNQPFWSVILIALDVLIIWALIRHGRIDTM